MIAIVEYVVIFWWNEEQLFNQKQQWLNTDKLVDIKFVKLSFEKWK